MFVKRFLQRKRLGLLDPKLSDLKALDLSPEIKRDLFKVLFDIGIISPNGHIGVKSDVAKV